MKALILLLACSGCAFPAGETLPRKPHTLSCLATPEATIACSCPGETPGLWDCRLAAPACDCSPCARMRPTVVCDAGPP